MFSFQSILCGILEIRVETFQNICTHISKSCFKLCCWIDMYLYVYDTFCYVCLRNPLSPSLSRWSSFLPCVFHSRLLLNHISDPISQFLTTGEFSKMGIANFALLILNRHDFVPVKHIYSSPASPNYCIWCGFPNQKLLMDQLLSENNISFPFSSCQNPDTANTKMCLVIIVSIFSCDEWCDWNKHTMPQVHVDFG